MALVLADADPGAQELQAQSIPPCPSHLNSRQMMGTRHYEIPRVKQRWHNECATLGFPPKRQLL